MKITLKEISSVSQEIALDLDWSDIENDFEKSIKSFSKKIKISGFRPGRVPRKILMDRFQPSIESEFIENSVNQYYLKALKEKRITPVNMGSVSDIDFKFEEYFRFKVSFEIEPKISLPKLKKNSFKVEETQYILDEEDVKIAVDEVRYRSAEIKTIEDGGKIDDFIVCDLQEIDTSGVPIIGQKLETRYIKIGQPPFDGSVGEKLIGSKPNQKVVVEIPKDEAGTMATFELNIKNIERQILPKLDENFVKSVDPDAKSLENYKERVKEKLEKAYKEKAEESFSQQLFDAVIKKVNPEFPQSMMDSYLNQMVEEVMNRNQGQLEREKVVETYKPIAEQNLKWYLVRKAIIDQQEMSVLEDELLKFIQDKKDQNPEQKKEIEKFYKKPSNKDRAKDSMMEKKILAYLKEYAKIKEVKVYTKDLRKQSEVNK
ncbi:MAG: trigger factor [Candidatus Neomarinimicrobiota bacterium]|nr:trigger factor [Candidatus Neomarinimicrobiota bacterium]